MTTARRTDTPDPSAAAADEDGQRRRLLILASAAAVLALLHFIDHAVRGELVVNRGLNPLWNHSGWPFDMSTDKSFLFPISFVLVVGLLVGGIVFTMRGKLWAGYWLVVSLTLATYLIYVHFVGFSAGAAETPSVISMSHEVTAVSIAALIDLFGLIAVFLALAYQAVRARQHSGRW